LFNVIIECLRCPATWISIAAGARPLEDQTIVGRDKLQTLAAQRFPRHESQPIDGNVGIRDDLAAFTKMALAQADIAFFRRGERRPSVAAEIQACVQHRKAPLATMSVQYEHYRAKAL